MIFHPLIDKEWLEFFRTQMPLARMLLGLSQEDLARMTGFSRSEICLLENGKVELLRKHYLAIAKIFEYMIFDVYDIPKPKAAQVFHRIFASTY